MGRYKTFAAGNFLPADMNGIEDDYEGLFSRYQEFELSNNAASAISSAQGALGLQFFSTLGGLPAVPLPYAVWLAGSFTRLAPFYIDSADWNAANRNTKLRTKVSVVTSSGILTTTNYTFGLYKVTSFGAGLASSGATDVSVGAVVDGSQVTFSNLPASASVAVLNSGDFNCPSAGYYLFGILVTGVAQISTANMTFELKLQMRKV